MTRKAKRRRETENKETVFFFGGKMWRSDSIESRAGRTRKKPRLENELEGLCLRILMLYDFHT
jgi:hypothetical protein